MKQKAVAIVSIIFICFSITPAQSSNWGNVQAVPRGTEVFIDRKNDDRVIGSIDAVTEDTIAITSDGGSFIIGKENVTKIFHAIPRDKKKALNRGALLGMLGGLGAGVLLTASRPPKGEEMPGVGVFFAGLGLGTWAGHRYGKGRDKGPLLYSAR